MNWKYIVIGIGAVVISGIGTGIFLYNQQNHEVKDGINTTAQKESEMKLLVLFDKKEYERNEKATVIILNTSADRIYIPSRNQYVVIAEVEERFQKYDKKTETWRDISGQLYSPRETEPGPRIAFLNPGEKITAEFPIENLAETLNEDTERYRIRVYYYEEEVCGGSTYWQGNNREFCEGKKKSVFSEEMIVLGKTRSLPPDAIQPAVEFCFEENKMYDYGGAYYIDADQDPEKETVVICWLGTGDKSGGLFVIDKKDNQYDILSKKDGEIHQRYYTFENLKVKDFDDDGIEEIMFEERGWTMFGSAHTKHMYVPKFNQWLWVSRNIELDDGTGVGTVTKQELSENLENPIYAVYKEILLKD